MFFCFSDLDQLHEFIQSLNYEQKSICCDAANSTLSSTRLHYKLTILKRYFIALNRVPHSVDYDHTLITQKATKTFTKKSPKHHLNLDPAIGLARVGSRAALNFSFAFLKRAWRLGEDTDLCSDLLSESLEALQMLPVATLFYQSDVSPVWLEVVERSTKFLRQVIIGWVLVFCQRKFRLIVGRSDI